MGKVEKEEAENMGEKKEAVLLGRNKVYVA